jgi:3-oxoacyl-[acyl-carrier protein] reductase
MNEEETAGMVELDTKTAIVTGAGQGIGRAIAKKLASKGATVVVNDLDAALATEAVTELTANGWKAHALPGDVTDSHYCSSLVDKAVQEGGLDIIVNNAGYTWDDVIHRMDDEQFEAMLAVHVMAPFRILRAAAEPLRNAAKLEAANGKEVFRKVVNVSSIAGIEGNAGQVNYSSAKAALVGMTKTLAKEWGRYKVNVNCVAFGLIETRLTATQEETAPASAIDVAGRSIRVGIPSAAKRAMASMVPLGRPGTPEEAADAVYLLCSPESNYISGEVLVASGGLHV